MQKEKMRNLKGKSQHSLDHLDKSQLGNKEAERGSVLLLTWLIRSQ
jgi:hypothetical protein